MYISIYNYLASLEWWEFTILLIVSVCFLVMAFKWRLAQINNNPTRIVAGSGDSEDQLLMFIKIFAVLVGTVAGILTSIVCVIQIGILIGLWPETLK